jgi:hypothetical protein
MVPADAHRERAGARLAERRKVAINSGKTRNAESRSLGVGR